MAFSKKILMSFEGALIQALLILCVTAVILESRLVAPKRKSFQDQKQLQLQQQQEEEQQQQPPRSKNATLLQLNVVDETSGVDQQDSLVGFSCNDRTYGYYAEVNKGCTHFHLCYPERDEDTQVITYHRISFTCEPGKIFDQQELVCVDRRNTSTPCGDSPKYYEETSDQVAEMLLKSAPQYFTQALDESKPTSTKIKG